jgi:hypothetical protein
MAADREIGKIFTTYEIRGIDKARKKFKLFERDAIKSNKKIESSSKKTAKSMEKSFLNTFTKIGAAILAFRQAFIFTKEIKNLARDAEEINNKFGQVFKGLREESEATVKQFAEDFKLATSTAKGLLGETGDLLVGFGFARKRSLELSNSIVRLASDLTSFKNITEGVPSVVNAIISAMSGIVQAGRSVGVVISQRDKSFRDLTATIQETEGVTFQQARALAVLNEFFRQSPDAIGDFARTQEDLANQERILNEELKTTKEIMGGEVAKAYKVLIVLSLQLNDNLGKTGGSLTAVGIAVRSVTTFIVALAGIMKIAATGLAGWGASIAQFGVGLYKGFSLLLDGELDKAIDAGVDGVNKATKAFSLSANILEKDLSLFGGTLVKLWDTSEEKSKKSVTSIIAELNKLSASAKGTGKAAENSLAGLEEQLKKLEEEQSKLDVTNEKSIRINKQKIDKVNEEIKRQEALITILGRKKKLEDLPTPKAKGSETIIAGEGGILASRIPEGGLRFSELDPQGLLTTEEVLSRIAEKNLIFEEGLRADIQAVNDLDSAMDSFFSSLNSSIADAILGFGNIKDVLNSLVRVGLEAGIGVLTGGVSTAISAATSAAGGIFGSTQTAPSNITALATPVASSRGGGNDRAIVQMLENILEANVNGNQILADKDMRVNLQMPRGTQQVKDLTKTQSDLERAGFKP